jgi:hypothetical protein
MKYGTSCHVVRYLLSSSSNLWYSLIHVLQPFSPRFLLFVFPGRINRFIFSVVFTAHLLNMTIPSELFTLFRSVIPCFTPIRSLITSLQLSVFSLIFLRHSFLLLIYFSYCLLRSSTFLTT